MQFDTISLQRYSLPGGLTVFWRTSSDTILTISSRSTCFANFDSIDSPVIQFDDPNQYKVEEVAAKVPLERRHPACLSRCKHLLAARVPRTARVGRGRQDA